VKPCCSPHIQQALTRYYLLHHYHPSQFTGLAAKSISLEHRRKQSTILGLKWQSTNMAGLGSNH